ncbi:MAG: GMC family oxidoreductase [Nevskia sp.]
MGDVAAKYDTIIVGTGFAGAFFLMRYLERAPANARVLVLERGARDSKAWQLQQRASSSIAPEAVFANLTPEKQWLTSPGFGGNSKCWWGGATRMMPGDFELQSRYGVGLDWPLRYDDLEAHYGVVEDVMSVSGPSDSPMPRARPFPQPPHRLSHPDELLKRHFPDGWYHAMTSRARLPTPTRAACCATGLCELCPVDAKFTIQNGLAKIYEDPRVTLSLEAPVQGIETAAGRASAVVYRHEGREQRADADLVVLAASALFNPHLLLRSGIAHPLLGRRLHEQMPVDVCLDLAGVKSYTGSTTISGNGYLFYEGEHRRDHAACLIETWNAPFAYGRPSFRTERGRWTERLFLRFMFDELPREDNTVSIHAANPEMAETRFNGYSAYAQRGVDRIPKMVETLGQALPIERIVSIELGATTAHIQGTVVMGRDAATSIVDADLVHHRLRNLLVLGASAFPTASPSYPTLTVSALSLHAADRLFGASRP